MTYGKKGEAPKRPYHTEFELSGVLTLMTVEGDDKHHRIKKTSASDEHTY